MFLKEKALSGDKREKRVRDRRVHLANERTFLAWVRTAIGILAFGFFIQKVGTTPLAGNMTAFACDCVSYTGGFLVILGVFVIIMAAYRFARTEKEISEGVFNPSIAPDLLIAALVVSASLVLFAYLVSLHKQ